MYEKESKWIKRSPNLPYLPVAYLKDCIIQQGLSIDGCCLCFFLFSAKKYSGAPANK